MPSEPFFVFVKIPGSIAPEERSRRFEGPLSEALRAKRLGTVSGGGSQLSHADSEGRRTVEWCGLDVDLDEPVQGLTALREELQRLGAPRGTVLQHGSGESAVEEVLYTGFPWPCV